MSFSEARLSDLLSYPLRSGVTVAKDRRGSGIPMVNMGELFRYPRLAAVPMALVEVDYTDSDRYLLRKGDLLFARRSLTLEGAGKCCLVVEADSPTTWESSIIRARFDHARVAPEFLYYYFLSPQGRLRIESIVEQVAAAGIRVSDLANLMIACPPLAVQQAVAEVLGALDDKIALNERIRNSALNLAEACYESAGPGSEPEMVGDLANLFDGPHATPHKTPAGPWFLSISSLKNGYLDLTESAHLSEDDFPRWTRRVQPQGGDVLFSYETRLGDAALMPPGVRGSLGRRMALLRSKSSAVSGALLLHAYLASSFQEEIRRRTIHGATVDRLPLKEMPGWRINLPVEGERERLSVKLDALHTTVIQTANENRTLADLRDTLLPQLITGKLRVKDATRLVEEAV